MMRNMAIYITTARKVRGEAYAAQYPHKAEDLVVVAQVEGRKKRKWIGPPTPENRARAEQKAAEWRVILERKELGKAGLMAPAFAEAAEDFLKRGLRKRAPGTLEARTSQVGGLKSHFGQTRLDRIDPVAIASWWDERIEAAGLNVRTGKGYLNALSLVFRHAAKSRPELNNPVPAARAAILGEIQHTADYRAQNEANCNPLTTAELRKLLPQLERFGDPNLLCVVLLTYDAGLRIGEALGLQWGDVWWGQDESDVGRHLHVRRSRRRHRAGSTKSGRSRKIAMSRRLRRLLLERYAAAGRPEPTAWVISQGHPERMRECLRRVCKTAGIRPVKLKDFRDTYASTLVTHGIVLKWVSLQLGHSNLTVTERHYAAYMAVDGYQNPWVVPEGQLPPDLFTQLDLWPGTKRALWGTKNRKLLKEQAK